VDALPKPWYNLEDYRAVRLREASYEAEIAEKFLEEGLIRNAAGKAFQAWKAVVAAYAVDKVDDLRKVFPGVKRLRGSGRRVEAMTPFPVPVGRGFHCGGLVRYSLCGVSGFVLGVVVRVGYRPTGSSDVGETPFWGHHPKHQTPQ
jgi:Archaeal PaREP1/PaREP8 family.